MATQFTVDLGALRLSEDERQQMNAAIQKAVASQLATMNRQERVALIPVGGKFQLGGIINGLYIRELNDIIVKELNIGGK